MEIARHWRLRQQRYSLVGNICPACDHKIFPPKDLCPNCGGEIKLNKDKPKGILYQAQQITSLPMEASNSSR